MTTEQLRLQKLERYLTTLENALRPFPVSDRAEILMEIKSHALDALERDPNISIDNVLSALGEPETVANRYLLERGMKPAKPPISPIVRWMVIGFLGTVALVFVFCAFLISRFDPIVKVDGNSDHVTLLGGLIEVDGKADEVHVRGFGSLKGGSNSKSFSGVQKIPAHGQIVMNFDAGKVDLKNADTDTLGWKCMSNFEAEPVATMEGEVTHLDFAKLKGLKCDVFVPAGTSIEVDGSKGKLDIEEPQFNVRAKIGTGKVAIAPRKDTAYLYDLKVGMGKTDEFTSSTAPEAYKLSIDVGIGKIGRDD